MTDLIGGINPTTDGTSTPIEQLTFPHKFTVRLEGGHEVNVTVDAPEKSIRTGMLQLRFDGPIKTSKSTIEYFPKLSNATLGALIINAQQRAQSLYNQLPKDVDGKPLLRGYVVQCLWHKGDSPHFAHIWDYAGTQFQLDSSIKVKPGQVRKVDVNALTEALPTRDGHRLIRLQLCYEVAEKPPGCRTKRNVGYVGIHALYLSIVNEENAPVAFTQTIKPDNRYPDFLPHRREWRWYQGNLYTCEPMNGDNPDCAYQWRHTGIQPYKMPPEHIAYSRTEGTGYAEYYNHEFVHELCLGKNGSKEERITALEEWAENTIIIKGQLWQVATEPHIYVSYDHQNNTVVASTHYGYSKDGDMGSYCNLLEMEEAIAAKQQTIKAKFAQRGIDKEIPSIDRSCTYEVLIPEAIQLDTKADHQRVLDAEFKHNLDSCRSHIRSKFNSLVERQRALEQLLAEVQGELLEVAKQAVAE